MKERVTARVRTMCPNCDLVTVRILEPTLSPAVYFGLCERCGKRSMMRDLGGDVGPDPGATPEEQGLTPGGELHAVPDGEPFLEGDPDVCPECQEIGRHDAGCPFPNSLQQAYVRWRQTEDGELITASIRVRALELRAKGWTHYGIAALFEVARYDRALVVGPDADGFKLNNSYRSRLARDLMKEPELEGFFETRELRS